MNAVLGALCGARRAAKCTDSSAAAPAARSFVFEGKPPELKRAELAKRSTKREGAQEELEAAKEVGAACTLPACCCRAVPGVGAADGAKRGVRREPLEAASRGSGAGG